MSGRGALVNAALGLLLLGTVVATGADEQTRPWRRYQAQYHAQAGQAATEAVPHEVSVPSWQLVDRCTTCHLGQESGAVSLKTRPFQAHPEGPEKIRQRHPLARFGCTSCHGGQGRRLARAAAHDERQQAGGWSAFTPPRWRCSRCHAQGGTRSPEGQRGAEVYLAQGCLGCHQPGRAGPGIGPDLQQIGLRGRAYLRQALLYPEAIFPGTVMPPLRHHLEEEGDEIESLLVFLQSLEPWPRGAPRQARQFSPGACTDCHRAQLDAAPPARSTASSHTCPYLRSEAAWLRCARCHQPSPAQPPPPNGAAATGGAAEGHAVQGRMTQAPEGASPTDLPPASAASRTLPAAAHWPLTGPVNDAETEGRETEGCPVLEQSFFVCGVCHRKGER